MIQKSIATKQSTDPTVTSSLSPTSLKKTYIKPLRTIVEIDARYADQIRDLLNANPSAGLIERLIEYSKDWRTRAGSAAEVSEAIAALRVLSGAITRIHNREWADGDAEAHASHAALMWRIADETIRQLGVAETRSNAPGKLNLPADNPKSLRTDEAELERDR